MPGNSTFVRLIGHTQNIRDQGNNAVVRYNYEDVSLDVNRDGKRLCPNSGNFYHFFLIQV